MEHIGISDLRAKTGEWMRRAARGEGVIITDRGYPVASLNPFDGKVPDMFKLLTHT